MTRHDVFIIEYKRINNLVVALFIVPQHTQPSLFSNCPIIMSSYVITGAARGIGVGVFVTNRLRHFAEIDHTV